MRKSLAATCFCLLVAACSREPRSYDDCILDHMKPGVDEAAAGLVMVSCRKKFPLVTIPDRMLSTVELSNLTGKAGTSDDGMWFSGKIYNGNEHVAVTELQLTLKASTIQNADARDYKTSVFISPQQASDFSISIIPSGQGAKYTWSLKSANGHSVP